MLASGLSFVGVNSIVRALGTEIPAAQSAFIRFAFGVIFLAPVLPGLWWAGLPKGALRLSLWRGAVRVAAVLFWFYAMARVPMAQVTAIGYLNPVILLIAGAFLLGEVLSLRRIIAVGLALCGTLIVLRPGVQEVTTGHLAQICAAICFAGSYLFAKRLSALVPASTVVALMSGMVTLGLLPLALWVWVPISALHLAGLALVALFATAGHYAMTRAFEVAPMTVTQPVTFLNLVWAALAGSLFFAEPVDLWVLVGGAVIVGAISWVTFAERRPASPPLSLSTDG
ncbi:MAG: DMT family transporter [Pseudorhodobacter sp.]|nr:MAG: DMT family transporter [Pseudorhodobacter sp.]